MNSLTGQPATVYPPQVYLESPEGTNWPPFTVIQRTHTGGCFAPTVIGECAPPPVQPSTDLIAATSEGRVSLPPSSRDFSTNSFEADHANSPKKVGCAPGATCWSHFL